MNSRSQARSAQIEPDEFYADEPPALHYDGCPNAGAELPCDECDTMTIEIREDFKMARRGMEREF